MNRDIPAGNGRPVYRFAISGLALLIFSFFAALWVSGRHQLYFAILDPLGFEPFRFPFLDTQAVLSAAECHRHGVDVYLSNPCDALQRPHVYSPLWLSIIPNFLGTADTSRVGVAIDLSFILLLPAIVCPRSILEFVVLGLAVFSPMTVFALERANNDLMMFTLVAAGGLLLGAPRPYRYLSYALFLVAGLLKYYPLVLLLLLGRERPRIALPLAAASATAVALFVAGYHSELAVAFSNVPVASNYSNAFSAANLPFGIAEMTRGLMPQTAAATIFSAAIGAVALMRIRRNLREIEINDLEHDGAAASFLFIGALLLVSCFVAGRNIDYRGIYCLFVLPGLVQLWRSAGDLRTQRWLAGLVAVAIFVMWQDFFWYGLGFFWDDWHARIASYRFTIPVGALCWLGRELLWWWLMTGLASIVVFQVQRMLVTRQNVEGFRRFCGAG
jgi:hypothetical protein